MTSFGCFYVRLFIVRTFVEKLAEYLYKFDKVGRKLINSYWKYSTIV